MSGEEQQYVPPGQQLKQEMASRWAEMTQVEVPQPSSGFASTDSPAAAPPEASPPEATVSPGEARSANSEAGTKGPAIDPRMQKVIAAAQKAREERAAIAQERQQLQADLDELRQFRELKERAKEDPVSVAEMFGYKPDEYATLLMEKGSLTPDRRRILEQQKELMELKDWRQKQEQAQEQARNQGLYQHVRSELESFAADHVDKFDLVHRTKSYDQVLAKIQEHYQQTEALGEPEILPYEDAFSQVERELEEYYSPVLESPKFRSRLAKVAEPEATGAQSLQPPLRKTAGTINSKMRAQSSAPKALSEHERLQKAGEVLLSQLYGRRG